MRLYLLAKLTSDRLAKACLNATQCVAGHRRRGQARQNSPANMLHQVRRISAMRTPGHMGRDRDVLSQVEGTGGESRQKFIKGMVFNGHENSPNELRSLFIAKRERDFTVPSGIWSIRAKVDKCHFFKKGRECEADRSRLAENCWEVSFGPV